MTEASIWITDPKSAQYSILFNLHLQSLLRETQCRLFPKCNFFNMWHEAPWQQTSFLPAGSPGRQQLHHNDCFSLFCFLIWLRFPRAHALLSCRHLLKTRNRILHSLTERERETHQLISSHSDNGMQTVRCWASFLIHFLVYLLIGCAKMFPNHQILIMNTGAKIKNPMKIHYLACKYKLAHSSVKEPRAWPLTLLLISGQVEDESRRCSVITSAQNPTHVSIPVMADFDFVSFVQTNLGQQEIKLNYFLKEN